MIAIQVALINQFSDLSKYTVRHIFLRDLWGVCCKYFGEK